MIVLRDHNRGPCAPTNTPLLSLRLAGNLQLRPRAARHDTAQGDAIMAEAHNKARNAAQGAKGKAKEATGRATGNDKLKAKGKTDQAKSKVKKAGERVKGRLR